MRGLNFNLLVLLGFIIVDTLGFVLDIIRGTGGSNKIYTVFLCIAVICAIIFLSKSSFNILQVNLQSLNKIVIHVMNVGLIVIQIAIAFIIASVLNLFIIAPLMIKLGFNVTMP